MARSWSSQPLAMEACIIEYSPPADGYRVLNKTVTGSGKGKGGVSVRLNQSGQIEVSGSLSSGQRSDSIPCDNPTLFAAAVFRHYLAQAGIPVRGAIRLVSRKGVLPQPTSDSIVAVYISPPMAEVVKTMMKRSNNHFAEQVFASVSAIKTGNGSYRASRAVGDQLLRQAGINPRDVQFEDGSGLSRSNAVTPRQMCQLLQYMSTHRHANAFIDSLPVAGQDGTLRGRMGHGNASHKVLAKTGYINNVVCLSGYLMLNSNQTLLFSFLVNDVKMSTDAVKSTQDKLCDLLSRLNL